MTQNSDTESDSAIEEDYIQIQVAIDPNGDTIPIDEAKAGKTDYYRCPECKGPLTPRKGSQREHHYAHKIGYLKNNNCSLGTEQDLEELRKRYRKPKGLEDREKKRIELILQETYEERAILLGKIPALNWERFDTHEEVNLDNLEISSSGVVTSIIPSNFHPSEPEVLFEIKPGVREFKVDIKSDKFEKISGKWTAEGLSTRDIFVGEPKRAKRIGNLNSVSKDDWIYIIVSKKPKNLPEYANIYKVGEWNAIGFRVEDDKDNILEAYTDVQETDNSNFGSKILLPARADPVSDIPIEGSPDSDLLVAIEPIKGTDPEFEIIPFDSEEDAEIIEKKGSDTLRYINIKFPDTGSKKYSIYQKWTKRHSTVSLSTVSIKKVKDLYKEKTPDFGLKIKDKVFNLLSQERSDIKIKRSQINDLTLLGPDGLSLDVKAVFSEENDMPNKVRRDDVQFDQIKPMLLHWTHQECEEIEFDFDAAGKLKITFRDVE